MLLFIMQGHTLPKLKLVAKLHLSIQLNGKVSFIVCINCTLGHEKLGVTTAKVDYFRLPILLIINVSYLVIGLVIILEVTITDVGLAICIRLKKEQVTVATSFPSASKSDSEERLFWHLNLENNFFRLTLPAHCQKAF